VIFRWLTMQKPACRAKDGNRCGNHPRAAALSPEAHFERQDASSRPESLRRLEPSPILANFSIEDQSPVEVHRRKKHATKSLDDTGEHPLRHL
jgi:hypothetical protein